MTLTAPRLACLLALGALAGCKAKMPSITEPFSDSFERAELGAGWLDTSGQARIEGGKLHVTQGYNKPVWLQRRLPANAVIELDVMSKSPSGDIKIELYGDGSSFDPDRNRYDPTGYVFVFGGWGNTESIIGRLGEHDEGVMSRRREPPVVPGQTYHWTISRKDGAIEWLVDGKPFLNYRDPAPLSGDAHGFLAFTNWESQVYFDNLQIRPL
ncbi:MAG TPA: hypothetical protein VGF45_07275 [Polyangia bacterium]